MVASWLEYTSLLLTTGSKCARCVDVLKMIIFNLHFSHFIIACKDKLTKWSTTTGDKILSIVQDDGEYIPTAYDIVLILLLLLLLSLLLGQDITSVAVSSDNRHIAIGLQSGDTHILDSQSGMLIFPLRYQV